MELNEALMEVNINEIRVLLITGEGEKSFVAGADIGEMCKLTRSEAEAFGKARQRPVSPH